MRNQGFHHVIQLPFHDTVELVERKVDSVIRKPSLGEIIGADALARSPLPTISLRVAAISERCSSCFFSSSRARMIFIPLARFLCCDFSS